MRRRILQACVGVVVAISVSACEMTKSEHPLGPTVAGPIPGVNITSPTPLEPAQGFRIAVDSQPVTLTLSNAATTGVRPLNYLFEVATDAGFANKVFSRDGIVPGASGRTTMKLPNALAPERSYYWRARAQDGANTGPYSSAAFFNVFTPVVLAKPILQEPVANGTAATLQPVLRFANAPRSGPASPITYEIQLADNEAFANVVGFWTVAETAGQTSLACPVAAHTEQAVSLAGSWFGSDHHRSVVRRRGVQGARPHWRRWRWRRGGGVELAPQSGQARRGLRARCDPRRADRLRDGRGVLLSARGLPDRRSGASPPRNSCSGG